tara:strand:- start:794 stop:1036 length:243 start_codon:yes stop_codon:yes gene_type:complete
MAKKYSKKTLKKTTKKQQGGRKQLKKTSSRRKGGFMETISTAIVPFGLFGLKKYAEKKLRKGKGSKKMRKFSRRRFTRRR